jgi:hypothetical protein
MSIKGPVSAPARTRRRPHRPGGLGEALGKGVIDAALHQDAVGTDPGLAGVAVFRSDRALNRPLDIGVVKDNERGLAAQFERFLDRAGAAVGEQWTRSARVSSGPRCSTPPNRQRIARVGRIVWNMLNNWHKFRADQIYDSIFKTMFDFFPNFGIFYLVGKFLSEIYFLENCLLPLLTSLANMLGREPSLFPILRIGYLIPRHFFYYSILLC